jgi:exonuclease VII small subunit
MMSDETKRECAGFNDNYRILKETADWLSDQAEPDIDELVPKVENAMQAYQRCKDRLTKVQEMLGQCFENSEAKTEPSPGRAAGKRTVRARPLPDSDEGDGSLRPS